MFLQFVLAQEVTGSLNCFYNLMLDSNKETMDGNKQPLFHRPCFSWLASLPANHDGVRATAIMLRSIAAGSLWRSPVAVKQASETTSVALRVKK